MLYVDLLVMMCLGVVSGTIMAPDLSEMLAAPARALATWSARARFKRQHARVEDALERAGRQVRLIRR
jgi:hypothetical protein